MAFIAIPSVDVQPGKPTKSELFDRSRTNFDDHETRISAVEVATSNFTPISFSVIGLYGHIGAKTGLLEYMVPFDITILGARLRIWTAGTGGSTEIDIRLDDGTPATIFSTRPSVGFAAGDGGVSTNAVLSTTLADAGDALLFDLTAGQSGVPDGFEFQLEFEPR